MTNYQFIIAGIFRNYLFQLKNTISFSKYRACGSGVCDNCSLGRKPVPNRGWDHPGNLIKKIKFILNYN